MKGLNERPAWVRYGIGAGFLLAAMLTMPSSEGFAWILALMALGLVIPSRAKPNG